MELRDQATSRVERVGLVTMLVSGSIAAALAAVIAAHFVGLTQETRTQRVRVASSWASRFDLRVRFEDGTESRVTLEHVLKNGTGMRLRYRRYRSGNTLEALFYTVCSPDAPC